MSAQSGKVIRISAVAMPKVACFHFYYIPCDKTSKHETKCNIAGFTALKSKSGNSRSGFMSSYVMSVSRTSFDAYKPLPESVTNALTCTTLLRFGIVTWVSDISDMFQTGLSEGMEAKQMNCKSCRSSSNNVNLPSLQPK